MAQQISLEELKVKIGEINYSDFLANTVEFRRNNKIDLILDETDREFEIWIGNLTNKLNIVETVPESQTFYYSKK